MTHTTDVPKDTKTRNSANAVEIAAKATATKPAAKLNSKKQKSSKSGAAANAPKGDNSSSRTSTEEVTAQPRSFRQGSKAAIILGKLQSARGATIEELAVAASWQKHSVRGFMSGTVKKKLGLRLDSEPNKSGVRRYRIVTEASSSKD